MADVATGLELHDRIITTLALAFEARVITKDHEIEDFIETVW